MIGSVLPLAAVLGLGGCTVGGYCLEKQDYQEAKSVPPIQGVDELALPQSQSPLVVPPPPEQPVPFGVVVRGPDGEETVRCLDKPPVLPEAPPATAEPEAAKS